MCRARPINLADGILNESEEGLQTEAEAGEGGRAGLVEGGEAEEAGQPS